MIRRCATSKEAEGIQRPHANTSQVIFFFPFLNVLFFIHSGYTESKVATAQFCSRAWLLMLGADLKTLGLEQKPGPVSRKLATARAKLHG